MSDTFRSGASPQRLAPAERWALPSVEGPLVNRPRNERERPGISAEEQAARGYEAGMARAQAEMQGKLQEIEGRLRRLDAVLQYLVRPLQAVDAEVEKQLLHLALSVGQQLARRELQTDPAQVVAIVRQCLDQLPVAARDVRVHLHPQDAAYVRERLAPSTGERAWNLVDDPTLGRGGCMVRTDRSQIDARFQSRIAALVASALGEQRAAERTGEAAAEDPGEEAPE